MESDITDELLFDATLGEADTLETEHVPGSRSHRRRPGRAFRRLAAQHGLQDILQTPPAAGESVHIVSASKFDFWTWVPALLDMIGPATHLYCSTWTLSRPNAVELFELWDAGKIGTASYLTGTYFKRRETAVYAFLLEGIRRRKGRYRAFQNHAKVMLLDPGGLPLVVESSANLTANPRLEQYVLSHDAELHAFHRGWFEEMYSAPARIEKPTDARRGPRTGYVHRRAGLGVMACSNNPAERRQIIGCKLSPLPDPARIAGYAEALADLVRQWSPVLPPGAVVTTPPQGASWPNAYFAYTLACLVAERLHLPMAVSLKRQTEKPRHGIHASLGQGPYALHAGMRANGQTWIVIDDMIASGTTMRTSLETLRNAGMAAFGFAYSGS